MFVGFQCITGEEGEKESLKTLIQICNCMSDFESSLNEKGKNMLMLLWIEPETSMHIVPISCG